MAYDEELAQRMRETLDPQSGSRKEIFGGIAFMIYENMAGPTRTIMESAIDAYESALELEHTRTFGDFRSMKGLIFVDWISKGVDFAESLPAK